MKQNFTQVELLVGIAIIAILGGKVPLPGNEAFAAAALPLLLLPSPEAPLRALRRRKFTLIELLVVIAIIAILASMLLPALNKARAKARTVTCKNNLGMLAKANLLYANDFGDYMVPAYISRQDGSNWMFNQAFASQLGVVPEVYDTWYALWPIKMLCPDSYGAQNPTRSDRSPINRSYTLNNTFNSNDWSVPAVRSIRISKMRQSAKKFMFMDGLRADVLYGGEILSRAYYISVGEAADPSYPPIAWRHNLNFNISFFDGHAALHGRDNLDWNTTLYVENWALWQPGWSDVSVKF